MAHAPNWIEQAAAIAVKDGRVCVVTSSSGMGWVIPKGCLEPGKTAAETALQEAWEEAGLVGILSSEPVGTYFYEKWGSTCRVTVFVMHVTEVADDWPERELRRRSWLEPARAVARIKDAGLRELLERVLG